jgi:hypothetical protein
MLNLRQQIIREFQDVGKRQVMLRIAGLTHEEANTETALKTVIDYADGQEIYLKSKDQDYHFEADYKGEYAEKVEDGGGTGTIEVTGKPASAVELLTIELTSPTRFRWRLDEGVWTANVVVAASVTLGSSGLVAAFTGTFADGDIWQVVLERPNVYRPNNKDIEDTGRWTVAVNATTFGTTFTVDNTDGGPGPYGEIYVMSFVRRDHYNTPTRLRVRQVYAGDGLDAEAENFAEGTEAYLLRVGEEEAEVVETLDLSGENLYVETAITGYTPTTDFGDWVVAVKVPDGAEFLGNVEIELA